MAQLRGEKGEAESRLREVEDRLALLSQELRTKEQSLTHLASNHSLTRTEADAARQATLHFEAKVQLLQQQLDRANAHAQQQTAEAERLRREARAQEERLASSLRESAATTAMDTLCVEIERLNSVLADNLEKMRELQRKNGRLEAEAAALRTENEHLAPLRLQLAHQQTQTATLQDALRQAELQQAAKQTHQESLAEELRQAREEGRAGKEEAKSEKEMRSSLQAKLEVMSREYEQLVLQIEQLRRPTSEQDEKMRILGSYEATIKHMKEEAAHAHQETVQTHHQNQQLTLLAHQMQERARVAEERTKTIE